jgi:prepilin-type N-terminal cleavage/methylation domain-containing protein
MSINKKIDGFTIIELLLGLAIFATIALSLYATFANGIRIHRKSQSVEDIYRDARMAIDILTLDLENMVPYYKPAEDYDHIFKTIVRESMTKNVAVTTGASGDIQDADALSGSFLGNAFSLSMTVPSKAGLKRIRYYLKEPDRDEVHEIMVGGYSKGAKIISRYEEEANIYLFVRSEENISDSEDSGFKDNIFEEVLSTIVMKDSLKFLYIGKKVRGQEDTVEWKDSWNEAGFPAGVHVEIAFVNSENEERPLLIQKNIFIPLGAWTIAGL